MSFSEWDNSTQDLDLTLRLDKWLHYLSESRIQLVPELGISVARMSNILKGDVLDSNTGVDFAKEAQRISRVSEGTTKEVFSKLYSSRDLEQVENPGTGTEVTQRAHELISSLPEFESLRRQVQGDPDITALATGKMMEAFNKALPSLLEGMKEEKKQEQKRKAQELLGMPPSPAGQEQTPSGTDEFRAAMRSACNDAGQEAAEVKSAMAGLKPGYGQAPAMFAQQDNTRLELAKKLSRNERLKKLMKLAGRLRRLSEASRKERDPSGVGVITGVTRGNDFMRMLPSEMAMLKVPQMRNYQLAKLAERKMAEYRMEGVKKEGRGPMIVMIDTSGSMDSCDAGLWASAIALSCAGVAQKEKRPITFIGFNRRVTFVYSINAKGEAFAYDVNNLTESTKFEGGAPQVCISLTSMRFHGGTSFDAPFEAAITLNAELNLYSSKADFLIVTDGEAEISPSVMEKLEWAKEKNNTRVYGLAVGGGSFSYALNQLCDKIVDVDQISREEEVASVIP